MYYVRQSRHFLYTFKQMPSSVLLNKIMPSPMLLNKCHCATFKRYSSKQSLN